MVHKIGTKETSCTLLLFSLPLLLLLLVGKNSTELGSGAILNSLICFPASALICLSLKFYSSSCGNACIIDSMQKYIGKWFSSVVGLVLFALLFLCLSHTTVLAALRIQPLISGNLSSDAIRAIIVVSSAMCAWLGIESVTRQGYVLCVISAVVGLTLIIASAKGINSENIYPVMGTSIKDTLTGFETLGLLSGVVPLLVMCGGFKHKKSLLFSGGFVTFGISLISFICFLLYVLTVPFPMGNLYPESLEAIFASASSGELFHRFEILLVCAYTIVCIASASIGFSVCSLCLSRVISVVDTKPCILILSPIVYYCASWSHNTNIYTISCLSLVALGLVLPILTGISKKVRTKRVIL